MPTAAKSAHSLRRYKAIVFIPALVAPYPAKVGMCISCPPPQVSKTRALPAFFKFDCSSEVTKIGARMCASIISSIPLRPMPSKGLAVRHPACNARTCTLVSPTAAFNASRPLTDPTSAKQVVIPSPFSSAKVFSFLSTPITLVPFFAKDNASAFPMPDAAPVITAVISLVFSGSSAFGASALFASQMSHLSSRGKPSLRLSM